VKEEQKDKEEEGGEEIILFRMRWVKEGSRNMKVGMKMKMRFVDE